MSKTWEPDIEDDRSYTKRELNELADEWLRADADRELCRVCYDNGVELPYGDSTGNVKPVPQWHDKEHTRPILDEAGKQLVLDYPEYECGEGHAWYKGEGKPRSTKGPNQILFESHLAERHKREIYNETGAPDPSINQGIYNRVYPEGGRKVNTPEQRKRNGASFYR